MTSICLNMIVKNERHVIGRCLDSVLPLISSWCILDTGSTDGTQELVEARLRHLPGALHQGTWKGFGPSRTEAIHLAKGLGDYLFFIDADAELILPEGFRLPELTADAYDLPHRMGETAFLRRDLVATRLDWRYVGVLHEYVDCGFTPAAQRMEGPWILERPEGARSQDPDKFRKDAAVLEEALATEPGNARYVFYLAQSYKDAGLLEKSVEVYRRRAAMGGWEEEVYVSLFRIAQLLETLDRPQPEVVHAYLEAFQTRPGRAETLGSLARYLRLRNQFHLAALFAERGCALPLPPDKLFLEDSYHAWRCLDEFAVATYWSGRYRESMEACRRLLEGGLLPGSETQRVQDNLAFAQKALAFPPSPTP
jgi:glycosyltransferase involved in cell wall biosynthesis